MLLERFVNGRARSNAYVYAPGDGNERRAVIVDAGFGAAGKIVNVIDAEDLHPQVILLTHGHPDHIWMARELSDRYEIPAYIHPGDLGWFSDPATGGHVPLVRFVGRLFGRRRRLRPKLLAALDAGLPLDAAGMRMEVLHTPGHSKGSVCFRAGDICFAGDTIFRNAVGLTAYPGGSRDALRESIVSKLLPLPDELRMLPGHGAETTVGAERKLWENIAGGQ